METEGARVRIDELRLAGFRAFENARLSLDDLTVLVGRNGAGKSTIIDAFEFLREAMTDGLEAALERRGGLKALLHRGSGHKKRLLGIALKLRPFGTSEKVLYGFHLAIPALGKGFAVEDEYLASRTEGGLRSGFLTGKGLSLPLLAQHDERLQAILDAIRSGVRSYKPVPLVIRDEPLLGPASILSQNGGNVGDVLKHVEEDGDDLAWIIKHLGAITPGIVGLKSGTRPGGRRIVQFFQRAGKTKTRFNIDDMSDGTLRCLAILLALRQRPAPAILGFDEIEDSIHPAALAVLLDAVSASTERSQVLLTSHSPEALSHPSVTAGSVRVVEWRDGRSEVFRLSPEAEALSRPPRSVGRLLRTNALFTAEAPERVGGDFFELA
jgi:predicted ATPase